MSQHIPRVMALTLWIVASGCASAGGPRSVQEGMSRQVLLAVMGRTDDRIIGRNFSAYKWVQKDDEGNETDFWVILQDDVVVATGRGELQEDESGNLIIVPLRR